MTSQDLPEVELYSIGPSEADYAAPLLTPEGVSAIRNGSALGMALAEEGELRAAACARLLPENDGVLELLSLYTAPACRRRGLGGTLLMELLERISDAADGSVHWVTAAFSPETPGMKELLARVGFRTEPDTQAVTWRLPVSRLKDSPLLRRAPSLPDGCSLRPLAEVPNYCLRQLLYDLSRSGAADLTLPELHRALPAVSYVLLDRDGCPKACAILSPLKQGGVYLSQFYAAGGVPAAALSVLRAAAEALSAHAPGDTLLEIPTLTGSSARLVQKLIPAEPTPPLVHAVLDLTEF